MKKLILAIAAIATLASCTKNNDFPGQGKYVCYIETWTPRGVTTPLQQRWVTFTGSYSAMKAFEQQNTWADSTNVLNDAPYGSWQTCHCYPQYSTAN